MTNKNNKKKTDQNLRGASPPSQPTGRDASIAESAEGESTSSGIFLPRESCLLISKHLKLAACEAKTALFEIEDCLQKSSVPEVKALRAAVQKIIGELRLHGKYIHSFANFSNFGPEHVMEAKRMIGDHHYAWTCFDHQLDAVDREDFDRAEFWRLCFAAFCGLWGEREAETPEEQKLILTASSFAGGDTELSPDEIIQLQDFVESLDH